ncbi:PilW family protein [Variovorax ginsengisoli]|uniref:PilW family protein n=1 Tax=Variovorax ginsengisoli TaxID=363844 RepID=A0ABT8S3D2_9BURK|nr:PilW family protein [Variovorax ginsengisoli]MDN8614259.1 PilW family protein [Variovorax ginsengisoli]MDO1533429.1 PilW family protein [Variovorax ginsengisoli]
MIELMVAVVIGLVVTLAVTSAVIFGEAQKRTTTSTNDMGQSGAYGAYLLDRATRSAGSGFTQSWDLGIFGCKLNASRANTAILPRPTAFPVPFQGFLGGAAGSANLRVSPVLIGAGQGIDGSSDVIAVMGGNGAAGAVPRAIRSINTDIDTLRLDNTIGLANGDMALVSQAGSNDCFLEQVNGANSVLATVNNDVLLLGGTYFKAGNSALGTMADSGAAYFTPLGNIAANDLQFQLFAVGANRTLFSYDLLKSNGSDDPQAIVEGVVQMNALYGMVNPTTGAFTGWVAPSKTPGDPYYIDTVMTTPLTARSIAAVRIALVMRSSQQEKADPGGQKVAPAGFTLFGDLAESLHKSVVISDENQNYRHRVVEFTIPLRNILLLPTT